jgi:hypothetical protein
MMLGRSSPTFPQFLSKRCFGFGRFKRFTDKMQPALRAIEALSRPRWCFRTRWQVVWSEPSGVDDGEVLADHTDIDLVLAKSGDAGAFADQRDELRAVEQGSIRIGAQEIRRQNLVEAPGVGVSDRHDVVVVEFRENLDIIWHGSVSEFVSSEAHTTQTAVANSRWLLSP